METKYPEIISIDGNIGSGKSTFLDYLIEYFKDDPTVVILKEPVDKWSALMDPDTNMSLLESYYGNPITFAFPFQMYVLQTLIEAINQVYLNHPQCQTIICERSIASSRDVFARMLHSHEIMNPLEYQVYLNAFSMIPHIEQYMPSKIFYLSLSAYDCHERVQIRNRQGEEDITMDYLEECEKYFERWLHEITIPIKIYDLSPSAEGAPQCKEQIKKSFIDFWKELKE